MACLILIASPVWAGTKYWVGGSGNWSDQNHWSENSGGQGGAEIPHLEDDVVVDQNSFSGMGAIHLDQNVVVNSFVANPSFSISITSGNQVVVLVDKRWDLSGLVNNEINGEAFLIGRHLELGYRTYASGEFIGQRKNEGNPKQPDNQVLQVTAATFNVVNQSCPGACDGQITVNPTDGTGPFAYQWVLQPAGSGANTTSQTVTQVCSGSQTVVIRDLSDPPGTSPFVTNVNMGPAPFVAGVLTSTNVTCPGGNDGSITTFVSGGTLPYLFQWDNGGGTDQNAAGVGAGTYTLTVTDALGCVTSTIAQDVIEPQPIVLTPTISDVPICGGAGCIEDVVFAAAGGNGAPFNFVPGNSATDMCPGTTFNLTVTDALGCPMPGSHTAADPPVVTVSATEDAPVTCLGVNDGAATASAAGGVGPYDYVWIDVPGAPISGASITGLPAGTWTVEATDQGSGCVAQGTVVITSPNPQVVSGSFTLDQQATCLAARNGEVTVDAAGGTAPYQYTWLSLPGAPQATSIDTLSPGSYQVEARDAIGCVDTIDVVVTAPAVSPVTATATVVTPPSCVGAANGEANASGSGGTGPYDFLWYDLVGTPTTDLVSNLDDGIYNVSVTDQDGCADTATINVQSPLVSPVTASVAVQNDPSCIGAANGSVTVAGAGGTGPYDFLWYDLVGTPTTDLVSNLDDGVYNVSVTDQDGCADTVTVTVQSPTISPVTASITSFSNVVCLGLPTGDATADGSGGTLPYGFLWYDLPGSPTTQMVSNLNVGQYNVEVTDRDGCKDTATVDIQAPNPPIINTALTITPSGCTAGACDAVISPLASGGRSPYTYDWYSLGTGPQPTGDLNNMCPGVYNLAVMDQDGCTDTTQAIIGGPITANVQSVTDVVCGGQCTGVADVGAIGGSGAYVFDWYDLPAGAATFNSGGDSAFNACAGVYNVSIFDGACYDTVQVTINEPAPVLVNIDRRANNICFGNCSGELDISFSGGTGGLVTVFIDSAGVAPVNGNNFNLTGLCNGTYTFEATDALGCTTTNPVSITSPQTLVAFNISNACPGDLTGNVQAVVNGGTAPYDITWIDPVPGNPKALVQVGISPGSYRLEVIDANLCTDTFTLNFAIPNPIAVVSNITDALCSGVCSGSITNTVTGGTGPYDFLWYDMTGNPTTQDLTNVCPGTYNLQITDALGCLDTATNIIVGATAPLNLLGSTGSTVATCLGICDAKAYIDSSAIGGISPYQFNWYDATVPSLTDTAFNICAGTFNLEIRDSQGCVDTTQVLVNANPSVSASIINQVDNVCSYNCAGAAEVAPVGGTLPYQIAWTGITGNPSTTAVSGLCNGTYDVTVTDAVGCQANAQAIITSNSTQVTFTETDPSCGGYNDGSVSAVVAGGQSPYQLRWINVPGNPTGNSLVGLTAGSYLLEVTDVNLCVDTFTAVLTDPFLPLAATPDFNPISCFGLCDGKAWLSVAGGVGPYQYDWYNDPSGSVQDTAYSLCTGTYFVAILDAVGCQDTAAVSVGNPFSINLSSNVKRPCFGLCDGRIVADIGITPPTGYVFQWDDPATTANDTVHNLCAGNYSVEVTSPTGCKDTAFISLSQNPQITATVDTTKTLCSNTTNGTAIILAAGGTLPFIYSWTDNSTYTSSSPNPTNLGIGKYYATVTDAEGCTYRDSVTISETYSIDADAGPDQGLCAGGAVDLKAAGGVTYLWSTGATSDSIRVAPVSSTTYTLTATNGPCTDQDDVRVSVFDNPTADVSSDRTAMLEGMSATFTASGAGVGGTYDWNPPLNISDPTSANPVVDPLVSTRYYLTVTNSFGCTDTTSILIKVIESIIYPDGVSPNGDGINDDWPIVYIENFPDCVVEIYNRWGQLLFQSTGYSQRWDGTHKGEELPVGTYYFVIDLGEGLPKYTGPITIFR